MPAVSSGVNFRRLIHSKIATMPYRETKISAVSIFDSIKL